MKLTGACAPAAYRHTVRQTRRILTRKEREQIGPFVVTRQEDLDPRGISCAECGKLLATYDANGDCTQPTAEELVKMGAVAVPNLGWFCGQACGERYEQATGIKFTRNSRGQIAYYGDE